MSELRFSGVIKTYAADNDGMLHLGVEDINPSDDAKEALWEIRKEFNPTKARGRNGYRARDVECTQKPGWGVYKFSLPLEKANDLLPGVVVDVVMDVFCIRSIRFSNDSWLGFNDVMYRLKSIHAQGHSHGSGAVSAKAEPVVSGKSGK